MSYFNRIISTILVAVCITAFIMPAFAWERKTSNVIVVMPPSNPRETPPPEPDEAIEAEDDMDPTPMQEPMDTPATEPELDPDVFIEEEEALEPDAVEDSSEEQGEEPNGEETNGIEDFGLSDVFEEGPELLLNEGETDLLTEVMFPENASVYIAADIRQFGDMPGYGDHVILSSTLQGLDGYRIRLQWQQSKEGADWFDIADATDYHLTFVMTEDNAHDYWRLAVTCYARTEIISTQLDVSARK